VKPTSLLDVLFVVLEWSCAGSSCVAHGLRDARKNQDAQNDESEYPNHDHIQAPKARLRIG